MIDRVLDRAMVVLVLPQWIVAAAGCIWWVGFHMVTGGLS